MHCGETIAVRAPVNGAGKSHWVLQQVAERQSRQTPGPSSPDPFFRVPCLCGAHS